MTARAAFNKVMGLINAGRMNAAAAACRETLEHNQNDVNVTALLGAILLKAREFDEAERRLGPLNVIPCNYFERIKRN